MARKRRPLSIRRPARCHWRKGKNAASACELARLRGNIKVADRYGFDARALQEWEQGCRVPDRSARVLLTVIDRNPEAVVEALGEDGDGGQRDHSLAS